MLLRITSANYCDASLFAYYVGRFDLRDESSRSIAAADIVCTGVTGKGAADSVQIVFTGIAFPIGLS